MQSAWPPMSSTTPIVGHNSVDDRGGGSGVSSSHPRALVGLYTDTSPEHGTAISTRMATSTSTRALRFVPRPFPKQCTIPHRPVLPRMTRIVKPTRIRVCGNGCNRLELAVCVSKLQKDEQEAAGAVPGVGSTIGTHLLFSLSLVK